MTDDNFFKTVFNIGVPPQWKLFCNRYPNQQGPDSYGDIKLKLTDEKYHFITAINYAVNNANYYTPDRPKHDHWKLFKKLGEAGDCEEFALTKRFLLNAAGIPLVVLNPVICEIPLEQNLPRITQANKFIFHMVLAINTNKGSLILDLRNQPVQMKNNFTNYKWYAIIAGNFCRIILNEEKESK